MSDDEICNLEDPKISARDEPDLKETFNSISKEFKRKSSRDYSKDNERKKKNSARKKPESPSTNYNNSNSANNSNGCIAYTYTDDSDKDSKRGVSTGTEGVYDIIQNLKKSINLYEAELKTMRDEKIMMQVEINDLKKKMVQLTSKKKVNNSQTNNMNLVASSESMLSGYSDDGLSRIYIQESTGLKAELGVIDKVIERQKAILNADNSILDESITYIQEVQEMNQTGMSKTQVKGPEVKQMEEFIEEINQLKSDLFSLTELFQTVYPDITFSSKKNELKNNSPNQDNSKQKIIMTI